MKNVFAVVLCFCVYTAFGQDFDNTIERKGFVIDLGMSAGVISISDSDQEVAFEKAQGGISLPNLKMG